MSTLYNQKDLDKLILQCPDEKEYPDPKTMIDIHGNKLYAYVTLVMMGDRYISAAIVLAHSLRKLNTQADLVVLITSDVSEDGKRVLSTYFDKVLLIDYVVAKNWRTRKQHHRKYLELVFTKFHLFKLTEYKKILLIDADALVLKYPDHIFSLNAPAGCFLEDKDLFITYDKNGNYILPADNKIKWYQQYCKCCGHGKLIPKEMTDKLYTNFTNSGIGGGLILLEPKKGEFESILKDISKGKMKYLIENNFVWPEQQYLTLRYSGKWHSINPRFFGLQGYPHWSVLYGLQYGGDKPFIFDSKIEMSIRVQYPDYILWHILYAEICDKYPTFKTNPALAETNEMHKFFSVNIMKMSRHSHNYSKICNFKKIDPIYIQNLFMLKYPPKNDEKLKSYFTDTQLSFRPFKLEPLFENIKPFDYFEPIKIMAEHDSTYFKNLYKKKININDESLDKLLLNTNIDLEDLDNIMLHYTKCRPSIFIITLWPIASSPKIVDGLIKYLRTYGNVYYSRNILLSYTGIRNLMFWMYDEFSFSDRLKFINKKLEYVFAKKNEDNQVSYLIFDNVKGEKISGQSSEFKKQLRNYIMTLLNLNNSNYDLTNLRGNDVLHINDHFYQAVTYAGLLLNKNSLDSLNNQTILLPINGTIYANDKYAIAGHLKFQTFLKWLYDNLSQYEINKIIVMGGTTLYTHGIRPLSDIDSILVNPNNPEFEQLMYDTFQNNSTKFKFADMGVEGKYWQKSWNDKNNKVFEYFGVKNINEVIDDPRYHFYYQGLKFYLLPFEIVRKLYRARKQDYADIIMMLFNNSNLITDFITLDSNNKLKIQDDNFNETMLKTNDGKNKITHEFINLIENQIRKKYNKKISDFINTKFLTNLLM
jgi:hypothetical protein